MSEFDVAAVDLSGILNKTAEEKAKQLGLMRIKTPPGSPVGRRARKVTLSSSDPIQAPV